MTFSFRCFVSVLEGMLLVCGGINVTEELQSYIQQYSPQTEKWSLFGELPFPLKGEFIQHRS